MENAEEPANSRFIETCSCLIGQLLVIGQRYAHLGHMFNILSALVGFVALICMIPTIIPFMGWANWVFVPMALFGALLGVFSSSNVGRNFCLIVAALGVFRLWIGGGLI